MKNTPIRYGHGFPTKSYHRKKLMTDKVIQRIGLCICLYDILKASDGLIGHGTGIANVNGQPGRVLGTFDFVMLRHGS